jgi:hypothetical protein
MSKFDKHGYLKKLRGSDDDAEKLRGTEVKGARLQVLLMVYTYTDENGKNAHPGVPRLATRT